MSYAHIIVRDDRDHDEGDKVNLKAYNDDDKANDVCAKLNAIVAQYDKDWREAHRGPQKGSMEAMSALGDKVVADLNAIIPDAGHGYSNHGVRFSVETFEIDWTHL